MTSREEAVELLDQIGQRRRSLREQDDQLREDTKEALRATKPFVSRSEAARRTALNRSTIYELYLGDENDGNDGKNGTGTGS